MNPLRVFLHTLTVPLTIPTAPTNAVALMDIRVVDTNHSPPKRGRVTRAASLREIDPEHPFIRYLGEYTLVVVGYADGTEGRYFPHLASLTWCRKGRKTWLLIGPWFTFSPRLFPKECDEMHSLELEMQPV